MSATISACTPSPGNSAVTVTGSTENSAIATPRVLVTSAVNTSGAGTKYVLVSSKSSASYAVQEQLAKLNVPTHAIGQTDAISGQIVLNPDGSIDSANSKFVVDVSTLKTDSTMRDNYVAGNILQSNQYPQAEFIPTQVSGLPSVLPQSGDFSLSITGNLTIRNVTKPVTWDVTGSISNSEVTGTATTSFTFEDFHLNQPRVPVVLSVVDKITLTVNLTLQAAGS